MAMDVDKVSRAINNSSTIVCNGQDIWTPPAIKESPKAEDNTLKMQPETQTSVSKVLSAISADKEKKFQAKTES